MFRRLRNALFPNAKPPDTRTDRERLRAARGEATSYRIIRSRDESNEGWRRRRREPHESTSNNNHEVPKMTWSPHLKAILEGIHDDDSSLSVLRGHEDSIVQNIYKLFVEGYKDAVTLTADPWDSIVSEDTAFAHCASITFPTPRNRKVNMLPFVLGDVNSLPEGLQEYYYDVILKCPLQESEIGKVLYLTVEEGFVERGASQRRGGLHIESPRYGERLEEATVKMEPRRTFGWGEGMLREDQFIGGVFMASTVSHSCRVYHALVDKLAVDSHGGLDYLRRMIPERYGHDMHANEVIWMTDRTPHEVLPQPESGRRQFFRLVTSSLSIWNAAYNTPNPKVPLPPHVKVVNTNRFTKHQKPKHRSIPSPTRDIAPNEATKIRSASVNQAHVCARNDAPQAYGNIEEVEPSGASARTVTANLSLEESLHHCRASRQDLGNEGPPEDWAAAAAAVPAPQSEANRKNRCKAVKNQRPQECSAINNDIEFEWMLDK